MSPLVPPSRSAVGLLALAVAFLVALVRVPSPLAAMDHGGGRPFDPRVFAATEAPGGLPPGSFVPDFRLTDHTGTTRELYYESTTKAIVLVFTGTGHPRALQTASALRALRTRFNAATLTLWQIDSNLAADRAAVAAEQTLFNNDTPVLMDDAQIVAAEYGATSQLEAFVINPANWTLSYRGPLDNADPATLAAPTQNFVADAVAALVAGTASPAGTRVSLPAAARPLDLPAATVPDYATEVAPIVLRRCVSCHSPGNIAPHVYGKFSDLADRGPAIRQDMLLKKMSPWHADPRYGAWANNAALTPAEAATLSAWARAGAPRGAALVDPLAFAPAPAGGDWPLGQPDLILSLPRKSLPSTGTLSYDYPELTIPNTEDKWLRAVYVKPGNRRVVHHALVLEGSQIELILQAITTGSLPGLNGFFAGYVPGLEQTWFPDGSGKLLKKGSKITVQMHYTTSGQPETDDTQLGFYFTATAPARELLTKSANNVNLSIPPGAKDYAREATFVPSTTKDVMLYELNPHMHYRGKRVRFDALYPDGTTETLLNVPQYDFNWQSQYRLAQPKRLPAGTAIRVSGAFDNSAQNPFNPNPRATVTFGEQTSDEMYIGYINYAELPDKVATAKPPVFASTAIARARVGEPFRLALSVANAPTAFRADALPAGLTLDATTGVLSGMPTAAGRRALTITADNAAGSAATVVDLIVSAPTSAPVFTLQPQSVRTTIGTAKVTLTAAATGTPKPTFTWFFKGSEFCNTPDPVLELTDITAAYAGDFTCVATNSAGTATSAPATLSLDFSGLVNLSARANVGTGANVVIPGIAVRGTKPKTLVIRAVGPTLGVFGVPGTLANPTLTVFDAANQPVLVNDNWGGVPDAAALQTASAALGAFALADRSLDAAVLVTLAPGNYTIQVAGSGTAATGVALVEVYEADATPSTLVNLSCRARVGTDADVLAAGFVIRGTAPRRLLIRGVGPTLGSFGVTGTLADPKLEVFRQGTATAIATNDNWSTPVGVTTTATDLSNAATSVGAFALAAASKDAALIVTLPPGTYTAQVSGIANTIGVAIVEVYDLP